MCTSTNTTWNAAALPAIPCPGDCLTVAPTAPGATAAPTSHVRVQAKVRLELSGELDSLSPGGRAELAGKVQEEVYVSAGGAASGTILGDYERRHFKKIHYDNNMFTPFKFGV